MSTDHLANEMAAALSGTFPRARISMLEPPEQVARGVFALIDERRGRQLALLSDGIETPDTFLDREELAIKVLAECLATWQAESMEAKVFEWCSGNPRRSIRFQEKYCTLDDPTGVNGPWSGEGASPGEALGKALIAFDEERGDDE